MGNLSLTRKPGEIINLSIEPGTYTEPLEIEIQVTKIGTDYGDRSVQLSINAPRKPVNILRHELWVKEKAAAAQFAKDVAASTIAQTTLAPGQFGYEPVTSPQPTAV